MTQQVSPEHIIGRNRLIFLIWKRLETQSVRFLAERRIGKTSVLKKMASEPCSGFCPIYLDLEKVHSADRFVEVLLSGLKPLMSATDKAVSRFAELLRKFGGTEVGGMVKIPELGKRGWQNAIEETFRAVCENNRDSRILLMLDELPYMLQSIANHDRKAKANENFALAILDTLRAARHEHTNLRMIFCGSVGLHHVLNSLRNQQHASQPVNDMPGVEIHPLKMEDAVLLTLKLLDLEQVNVEPAKLAAIANLIASQTDCVPFYIERVVNRLAEQDATVVESTIEQTIRRHLMDDKNDWEMDHFRQRLKIYYEGDVVGANNQPILRHLIARRILDHIAIENESQSIDKVWNAMKAKFSLDDRDAVIELLSLLAQDHYLITDDQKHYTFRFPLIRRWWIISHGLNQGGK